MLSGTGRHDGADGGTFTDALSRLKRRGASVLVVGSVRATHRRTARDRLLGRDSDRSRRRILVSSVGDDPGEHSAADASDGKLIRYRTHARSATALDASSSATGPSVDALVDDPDTLSELGIAVSRAVEEFEAESGGLEPGELRVGVDSLVPLLEEYDRQSVFTFVHLITGRATDVDGMIHYHLPVDRDADVVPVFSPLCDVLVELREEKGDVQERWTIQEESLSTPWMSVNRS